MIWLLLACRPDPGAPVYPSPSSGSSDTGEDPDFLTGDTPFDGTRLSLGIFYEGDASETVLIDDAAAAFYIYESSFSVVATDDRVEGYTSDELTVARDTWWGGGIHWLSNRDISSYTTLHVALRSDGMVPDIGMKADVETKVSAASYGFAADGEWHALAIPLADFGLDTTSVEIPLLLVGEGTPAGSSFHIDDLYLDAR